MKLLVDHDLAALNAFLSCVNVGDYVVSGQAESYSCTSRRRDATCVIHQSQLGIFID